MNHSTAYNMDIKEQVENYVTGLFHKVLRPELVYHNLAHTRQVVKRSKEIAANCSLNETEIFIVVAAAWFHDCGHLFGPGPQHEQRSVVVMRAFLAATGIEEDTLRSIEKCILATQLPCHPGSLLEKIVCDADSYHLGTPDFKVSDELVKKEFEMRYGSVPENWDNRTLTLLENHTFFTDYCQGLLQQGKQKNIDLVRAKTGQDIKE